MKFTVIYSIDDRYASNGKRHEAYDRYDRGADHNRRDRDDRRDSDRRMNNANSSVNGEARPEDMFDKEVQDKELQFIRVIYMICDLFVFFSIKYIMPPNHDDLLLILLFFKF